MKSIKIAPSILSADFSCLKDEINKIEEAGADWIHVDVMDGSFVPNITVGPFILEAIKRITSLTLDVHLMIDQPERYIPEFANSGADIITVHVEASPHIHRAIQFIKEQGKKAGVTLNPATPLPSVKYLLDDIDLLLIMSVNPGFSGQKFISQMKNKINRARQMIDSAGRKALIEVDGGVRVDNVADIAAAGADVVVSGSGIFGTTDYKETIAEMRRMVSFNEFGRAQ